MHLKPRYVQRDCVEGDKIDLRQADAVLKHKPDIIIFELPQSHNGKPGTIFNRYSCAHKPIEKVEAIIKGKKHAAKKFPYAASDIAVWENIQRLWKQGVNVQIYNVDAPIKMRREYVAVEATGYPSVRKDWLFWVYLYLRDTYMARNIKHILDTYSLKSNPTILVCLQSIHWKHAQFLLTNPSSQKTWKYYFGKFPALTPSVVTSQVRRRNRVLGEYWKKLQHFTRVR